MIIATQTESKLYSYSRLYVGNSRTEVIYLGYPLELTKKEYFILYTLLENVSKPLSAKELIKITNTTMTKKNVVYHVSSINRKAKKIGKRKIIHNRSKIGYFLNEEM